MDISITVSDEDRERLRAILGPGEDDARIMRTVLEAGASEALAYATGRAVFSTMTDLRMFRVYCLLTAGMSMDEAEKLIALLFKVSPASARRIASATFARYSVELTANIESAIQAVLNRADWDKSAKRWKASLPPGYVHDRVLDLCASSALPDPAKRYGAVWNFPDETYAWLRQQVRLAARKPR
jgi:hypothetical protein